MRTIVSVLLLLVVVEGILLLQLRRVNQALHVASLQIEPLQEELARITEAAARRDADVHAFEDEVVRLQEELDRTKTTLNAMTSQQPRVSKEEPEVLPLGLTTNDVDLAGMLVRGTDTTGTLFIPLIGKSLERAREIRDKPQALVFGWRISEGYAGLWRQRDSANLLGFALHFSNAAEAESVAAKMRELAGDATKQ